MNPTRVARRSLLAALAMTVMVVAPASAHPFIAGGELPVDSLATMQLNLAHGCGGDGGGEEAPTTEVALQVPDWLRVVEVTDSDGYSAEAETDADGRVTTVTWTADGEGVPAPVLDLDVVASGTPGDALYLPVFQGCGEDGYRWIGTPEEPADDPAINVTLAAADPDSPAPPEETAAPEPEPEPEPTDEPEATDEPTEDVTEEPTDEPADEATEDEAAGAETDAAADEDDEGGLSPVLLGGLVVVLLAAAAVLAARRRRGGGA